MTKDLDHVEREALQALEAIDDEAALTAWRTGYLGRKGEVTEAVKALGSLSPEERPAYGRRVNEVKQALEAGYEARLQALKEAAHARSLSADAVDVTLPGRPPRPGRLHPVSRTLREIYSIFGEMGYQVYRACDVETDEYNFALLNMPPHHPARDMWAWGESATEAVRTHDGLANELLARQCDFDLIDDDTLAEATVENGELLAGEVCESGRRMAVCGRGGKRVTVAPAVFWKLIEAARKADMVQE